MGRRFRVGSVAALVALTAAAPLHAQEDEGPRNEGALWLLLPISAKAVSMGRAMTALAGPESVWWNPAGLAELDRDGVLFFRGQDLSGDGTAASVSLAREGLGAIAISYQLLDVGDQELRDDIGGFDGTLSFRSHLGVISMATRFWDGLNVGLNLKVVRDQATCRGPCSSFGSGVVATTFALDAGVQAARVLGLPLRVGVMLAHAGPDLKYENDEQADPLPTRLRLAAAYEVLEDLTEIEGFQVWVTAEVEDRWHDFGETESYFGLEFLAGTEQFLALRAGYVTNSSTQVDGAAVGLGLRWESFDLGIAKSLTSGSIPGEEPVHISFGFLF